MKFSSKAKGRIPEGVVKYLVGGMTSELLDRQKCLEIAPRMLWGAHEYHVNQVSHLKNATQLVLEVAVQHETGDEFLLKILIDSGAEENLVRKGFFPDEYFYSPTRTLNFVMANGQPLAGGKRVLDLSLAFREVVGGYEMPMERYFQATFYEADIRVDAILSYTWLRENNLGLFPHHKALSLDHPRLTLLYGAEDPPPSLPKNVRAKFSKKGKKRRKRAWAREVTSLIDGMGGEPREEDFESYVVRKIARDRIFEEIPQASQWKWVDAFADPQTAQFEELWEDALSQDWDRAARQGKVLWIDPPLFQVGRGVQKN